MKVKALRDCFVENSYRAEGEEFDYSGPKNTNLVPVTEPDPVPQATGMFERVDLTAMSKAQIINHAKDEHGLELDPSLKKVDLIAAVEDHVGRDAPVNQPEPAADVPATGI